MTKKILNPSLLLLFLDPESGIRDPGSEIRDPGSGMGKNQDPGSRINVPDPQHCRVTKLILVLCPSNAQKILNMYLTEVRKNHKNELKNTDFLRVQEEPPPPRLYLDSLGQQRTGSQLKEQIER
jgi:hypothetical protein